MATLFLGGVLVKRFSGTAAGALVGSSGMSSKLLEGSGA